MNPHHGGEQYRRQPLACPLARGYIRKLLPVCWGKYIS
nr:MAG TPA: hypothetical protein [Caudoviricetes sp.]